VMRVRASRTMPPFAFAGPDAGAHGTSSIDRNVLGEQGVWEPIETTLFKRLLERDCGAGARVDDSSARPLVLDVGVNLGYFSMYALALGCRVAGVEANTELIPYIASSLALNGVPQHQYCLYNAAASDSSGGSVSLQTNTDWALTQVYDDGSGIRRHASQRDQEANNGPRLIPKLSIDDIIGRTAQPLLVKMDIEGAEGLAVSGLAATLARKAARHFIIEIKVTNRQRVVAAFVEAGYTCYVYVEQYGNALPEQAELEARPMSQILQRCPDTPQGLRQAPQDFVFSQDDLLVSS